MIRRLFKFLTGGEFLYRSAWEAPPHSCRLPHGNRGDIWKCNCGSIYKCLGLSMFAEIIQWRRIEEDTELVQEEQDEII